MRQEETKRISGFLAPYLSLLLGSLVVLFRLVPHPPNFTPMGAMGLYSGGRLPRWLAFAFPLFVMVATDFGLWFITGKEMYSPLHISRYYVYPSILVYVALGLLLRNRNSIGLLVGATLVGSLQFFLLTNFFDWLCQPLQYAEVPEIFRYSRDLSGLLNCYVAGLPFYEGETLIHDLIRGEMCFGFVYMVLGDLAFTLGSYGLHALLAHFMAPVPGGVSDFAESQMR